MRTEILSYKSALVVEDVDDDGEFYSQVFGEVRMITLLPSLSFEPVHGGGSAIRRVFEKEIRKGRVVVCIADTDKSAPMDKMSDSSQHISKIYSRRNLIQSGNASCFVGLGIATDVREVENYIPYKLYKIIERFESFADFKILDNIIMSERNQEEDCGFWKYFDVKNGIDGKKLSNKLKNRNLSPDVVDWIVQKCGFKFEEIEGMKVAGFGDGVIGAFLESNKALSEFHKIVRSNSWQSDYKSFFERIIWFLVAPKRTRI